jgi:integrase
MARLIGRLSARKVKTARPKKGRRAQDHADGGNLFLQTSFGADGHVRRSWTFKYELRGRRREMGLGATHTRTLKEARDEAKRLRQLLLDAVDPIDSRDRDAEAKAVAAAKDKTFSEVARQYLTAHRDDWTNLKHAAQWQTSLTKEAKAIVNLPVAKIDVSHVLSVLQPIWKSKPESASRLRGRIERVLAYAIAAQYRTRESGNPAKWDGSLKELLGSTAKAKRAKRERTNSTGHHAAVPYADMPKLMAALRARKSLSARALEFTILTAARTAETIRAEWSEFDLEEAEWSIPGSKMKTGKPHRVALSPRAVQILRGLKRQGGRVFPLGNIAMLKCLRGLRPGMTVHGTARSSFTDWSHEQTAYPKTAIDMALAHAVPGTDGSYRRGDLFDKRRKLMEAWADYLAQPPTEKTASVTPMRKPRAEVSA